MDFLQGTPESDFINFLVNQKQKYEFSKGLEGETPPNQGNPESMAQGES